MTRLLGRTLLAVALLSPCVALAQTAPPAAPAGTPPAAGAPRPPRGPRPAPVNIKALPKDITGDDLIKKMREYEGALGVECEYCHAKNPETKRNDFVSDANPLKETARYMITMTAEINAKYLPQIADRKNMDPVTCGTCHQGAVHPAVFVPKPEAPRPPAGAAPMAPMAH